MKWEALFLMALNSLTSECWLCMHYASGWAIQGVCTFLKAHLKVEVSISTKSFIWKSKKMKKKGKLLCWLHGVSSLFLVQCCFSCFTSSVMLQLLLFLFLFFLLLFLLLPHLFHPLFAFEQPRTPVGSSLWWVGFSSMDHQSDHGEPKTSIHRLLSLVLPATCCRQPLLSCLVWKAYWGWSLERPAP